MTSGGNVQNFAFSVLPGDFNNDRQVTVGDLFGVLAGQGSGIDTDGTFSSGYELRRDVNGDGAVTVTDLFAVLAQQNATLPTQAVVGPSLQSFAPLSSSSTSLKTTASVLQEGSEVQGLAGSIEQTADLSDTDSVTNTGVSDESNENDAIDSAFSELANDDFADNLDL